MKIMRIMMLAVILTLAGTQALQAFLSQYGSLSLSGKTKKFFETYQIVEGCRYYTSGTENKPQGIIGIRKEYELRSSLWKEIPANREALEKAVRGMRGSEGESQESLYGADILEPDGTLIGYWYADKRSTIVKMIEDKTVEIYPPSTSNEGGGAGGGSGG